MSATLPKIVEIGYESMTRDEVTLLFRLVSYRYGLEVMMVTINKAIRDWPELVAGDAATDCVILRTP